MTQIANGDQSVEILKEWFNSRMTERETELFDDKVRKAVQALPYSAEGYNRAVAILKERYGKEREIVKAYVKEILELPPVLTANARKIREFYEKLTYGVQSLQTMNKLSQVDGAVAMTLGKLPAIRGDLVHNDSDRAGEMGLHTAYRGFSTLDEKELDH
ncbi:Hypothetical predicted protein [Paramuricea clavata]|uniref:Uncharacterized protein n=1 Tax=Paramuricea clavata TaxID=317549 RepID=A0A6S7HHR6_PARCT|nr:Hypothetical predicted protein [Paramuricea clavata]